MYLIIKRIFDILFALMGILFLSPLFIVISILLKFSKEGAIFYFQERVGLKQKKFRIWKFNSMLIDSINLGNKSITLRNDSRITPLGKYLRITKINELPQIINVLIGDMSFVGARPLIPSSFEKYSEDVKNKIYNTRPGITGIGSLIFRDEENLLTEIKKAGLEPIIYYRKYIYPYKGALELWYQQNISFTVDFKILFLTFWQILFSGSELTFKVLKDLPERPTTLTLKGVKSINLSELELHQASQPDSTT